MKGTVVALDTWDGRKAAARIVDGRLEDLLIDPADAAIPVPGAIYRAIARRPMKGQGGVMLALPDGTAFLRQAKGIRQGQASLVQVSGYAEPGKAVPVTDRLIFKGRYAIVTPGAAGVNVSRSIRDEAVRDGLLEIAHEIWDEVPHGLILRSAAGTAPAAEVADDITAMRRLADDILGDAGGANPACLLDGPDAHLLAWREWSAPAPDALEDRAGAFADLGVDEALDALAHPSVALPGGGTLWVEPTRALVAIDVNTGGDTSPAAGLKANLAAAREAPRQLRLRGLGGQIALDLAPMPRKERRGFEHALRAACRADPVETALAGWTPLGHFELQRKRERAPL